MLLTHQVKFYRAFSELYLVFISLE